jgi:hypothetical protein
MRLHPLVDYEPDGDDNRKVSEQSNRKSHTRNLLIRLAALRGSRHDSWSPSVIRLGASLLAAE